jgi:hypothetical protein
MDCCLTLLGQEGSLGEKLRLREQMIDVAKLQRLRKGSKSGSCRELDWRMWEE